MRLRPLLLSTYCFHIDTRLLTIMKIDLEKIFEYTVDSDSSLANKQLMAVFILKRRNIFLFLSL